MSRDFEETIRGYAEKYAAEQAKRRESEAQETEKLNSFRAEVLRRLEANVKPVLDRAALVLREAGRVTVYSRLDREDIPQAYFSIEGGAGRGGHVAIYGSSPTDGVWATTRLEGRSEQKESIGLTGLDETTTERLLQSLISQVISGPR